MRKLKDSGVEWLGQIPSNWEVVANKHLMKKVKNIRSVYSGEDVLSLTMRGVIVRDLENPSGKMPATFDGYQYVEAGNLLMCLFDIDVTPRCIGLIKNDGVCSPAYSQFRLTDVADAGFYYYYYLNLDYSKELLHLAKNLRHSLTEDQLGAIPTALPPIEEQRKIVCFLDERLLQVDDLITNVQSQIEKLKAYKQSLLTEVITKGLQPNARTKDSGVEWLGAINESFSVCPIRSIFRIKKEIIGREPSTVLSITQNGLRIKNVNENEGQMANSYAHYQIVKIGDFAMNHMDLITGGIGIAEIEGVTSPDYRVFEKKNDEYCSRYFLYLFEMYYKNRIFYAFGQGAANIGRWRLPAQNFNSLVIPVPPVKDQFEIAAYLDEKCSTINQLIDVKQRKIDKLNEYKKSLIYEYVTGKKEVQ